MRKVIFTLLSFFFAGLASANNITVSNTSLGPQNAAGDFTLINFDVAWNNSWRTSTNENNYDGAWIFVKFRKNGTTDWRHCTINATGNTPAGGAAFSIPSDGKGAFVYRSGDGIGNVSFIGNILRWNYGADGLLDNETVEIRVFALEMVYIPQGSFFLGSGGNEQNAFRDGSSTDPFLVTGNGAITAGSTAGTLGAAGQPPSSNIPANYPKGFNAFWVMKYETSQQQFVDFLNHIDLARANTNNVPGIFTGTHPALVAPQPERGYDRVGFLRTAAHADWCGLRPMTELEFEKACRGFNTPAVPNEFAWGNTTAVLVSTLTNPGAENETVATPLTANANMATSVNVPTRVGLFARPTGSSRVLSGGTYYGVMNMSDNLFEDVFHVLTAQGLALDAAVHGDGYLGADGNSNIATWNDYRAWGRRGSAYNSAQDLGRVSDRNFANYYISYPSDINTFGHSFRLVRSAQ